ncbi:hypothetical protein JYT72_01960 [Crocinitomix catalasitica]|nr:hypothetical protein [Crocinitomix catalasitica]
MRQLLCIVLVGVFFVSLTGCGGAYAGCAAYHKSDYTKYKSDKDSEKTKKEKALAKEQKKNEKVLEKELKHTANKQRRAMVKDWKTEQKKEAKIVYLPKYRNN